MVKAVHAAGLEVILEVVYDHTGEGDHFGPILSLKGIDNRSYYRNRWRCSALLGLHGHRGQHQRAASADVDAGDGRVRYWVRKCTRTDSAPTSPQTLERERHDVDRLSATIGTIRALSWG